MKRNLSIRESLISEYASISRLYPVPVNIHLCKRAPFKICDVKCQENIGLELILNDLL